MEEPGSLEVEYFSTFGTQRGGNDFHAFWTEFEYGATAWWTTEFYFDGQSTFNDSTIFTGFRWENRFRLLKHEHFINPVLYVEYENTSGADKILKEIEGHDVEADNGDPNSEARQEHGHELETKLLALQHVQGLEHRREHHRHQEPLGREALGIWICDRRQPAAGLEGSPERCNFCRENFIAGAELYGGLGDRYSFGLHDTSHYLAPVAGLEPALGLDRALFARLRIER